MKTSNKLLIAYFIVCFLQIITIFTIAIRVFSEKYEEYQKEINQELIMEDEPLPVLKMKDFID